MPHRRLSLILTAAAKNTVPDNRCKRCLQWQLLCILPIGRQIQIADGIIIPADISGSLRCTVISILLVCGQRRIQRAVTASYHGCTQIIRTERFPLGTSAVIGDIIASVIVGIAVGAVKPAVRADHWRIQVPSYSIFTFS